LGATVAADVSAGPAIGGFYAAKRHGAAHDSDKDAARRILPA
jgi:hypothetical protein